jgi:hypothetical protein
MERPYLQATWQAIELLVKRKERMALPFVNECRDMIRMSGTEHRPGLIDRTVTQDQDG